MQLSVTLKSIAPNTHQQPPPIKIEQPIQKLYFKMLEAYRQHTADRAALGIPPLPLDAEQTSALCELLQHPPAGEEANLIALLRDAKK
jgi:Aconitate B N-terminal domain